MNSLASKADILLNCHLQLLLQGEGTAVDMLHLQSCKDRVRQLKHSHPAKACVKETQEQCLASSIRGFKSTWLTMDIIKNLLRLDHSVKVIYSIGNPIDILKSRMKETSYWLYSSDFSQHVRELCTRMENDYDLYKNVFAKSKNFYLTNYDRLKSNVQSENFKLGAWLGLPKLRGNTTIVVPKLKSVDHLTNGQMKTIHTICGPVMSKLGYQ